MTTSPKPLTLVYKSINGLDLELDIYLPAHPKAVPVLIWFHGGGLLQGRRDGLPSHYKQSVTTHNHALVSADYRLAPQVKIGDILQDVKDCIDYVRSSTGLAARLDEGLIDTKKLAIGGNSAGGYLALLSGLYCEPKPNVILPVSPITDPLGYFFTSRQPVPLFKPPGAVEWTKKTSSDELAAFLDSSAKAVSNCSRDSKRNNFYYHMLWEANLAELLGLQIDEHAQHNTTNDRWRIARSIREHSLPPTYITHGDLDRAVGVEQSDEVVGAMKGLGLTVVYERIKDVDHDFDYAKHVSMSKMYDFMHKQFHDSKL